MQEQALTEEVELERERFAVYKKPVLNPTGEGVENTTDKSVKWQSIIADFLRYQENIGRAPMSVVRSKTSLLYWQRYLAEQKIEDLSAVTPQVVAGYQTWIFNYKTRFNGPFSLESQIGILSGLQVLFRYLVKTGKLLNNPAEGLRLPKHPKRLPAVLLSSKEMKALLAQPDISNPLGFRDRTILEVLYSTGIRIGELIRLKVQDVNLAEGLLRIENGKGNKDRIIPAGAVACRFLREYLEKIRPMFRQKFDYMFLTKNGRRMENVTIGYNLKMYVKGARIKKRVTIHTFRHTLATEMLKAGADLRQIQEMLGHGNLSTTQLYTHIVKDELKRIQAECHPREQTELPENFVAYRGRKYLTDEERKETSRVKNHESSQGRRTLSE